MMRVDRETFLFLAAALSACHAEHRRAPDAEPPEPASTSLAGAPREPEPEPESPADAGAATPDAGADGSSLPRIAANVDAGDAAPLLPAPRSKTELGKMCAAMTTAKIPECPNERKQMCQTVLTEFAPMAATRAIECLASFEVPCDSCGVRVCVASALVGLPTQKVAECVSVAKSAEQSSEGYGQVMGELCDRYASGMTALGRARFTQCLKKHIGAGVRICLWDPSVTPCTEKSGSERGFGLSPATE